MRKFNIGSKSSKYIFHNNISTLQTNFAAVEEQLVEQKEMTKEAEKQLKDLQNDLLSEK